MTPDSQPAGAEIEATRGLMAGLVGAWNSHDLDRATNFFATDYMGHDVALAEPQHGREGMYRALSGYFRAIPDVRITMDDLVVQGEHAVLIWTARGTHCGNMLNIPATGRSVCVRGVSTFTLREGEISGALHIWDVAGLLREIGLLPEL